MLFNSTTHSCIELRSKDEMCTMRMRARSLARSLVRIRARSHTHAFWCCVGVFLAPINNIIIMYRVYYTCNLLDWILYCCWPFLCDFLMRFLVIVVVLQLLLLLLLIVSLRTCALNHINILRNKQVGNLTIKSLFYLFCCCGGRCCCCCCIYSCVTPQIILLYCEIQCWELFFLAPSVSWYKKQNKKRKPIQRHCVKRKEHELDWRERKKWDSSHNERTIKTIILKICGWFRNNNSGWLNSFVCKFFCGVFVVDFF